MDKAQARQIIKDVFENPFDKNRFTNFIRNLLNSFEDAPLSYKGNIIYDAFDQHISTMERIGKYSDNEFKIDILIVKLKKETSVERARTMQRNFIARYLNGSRGGELKDAALVAFVSPSEEDWRFSLVKMDYKFEETKSGKIKVRETFTPARRWSFLVGSNENSHTAQQQLVPILQNTENNPTLARIEQAFNIEKVTDEFFENYRELFICTKETLDKVVSKDPKLKADFESKNINTVDFSKKLLGQIVFLQFLQKRGWFGVARDADFGTGPKHFLRELFEGKHGKYKNFFNDILEPLFYEALRTDRREADNFYSRFNCRIPFLNGGLFDPVGNYDWVHTDITLPNELFSNIKVTKQDVGNGILDVFDRFNFTVNEDEPLEKEVAIDPELLGKAYEKFNAIRPDNFEEYKKVLKSGNKGEENKFNKQYGVYYTPRDIVHFMCRQSLISYLSVELSGKIDTDTIEFLILEGEKYIEYLKTAGEKKEQDINSKKYKETKNFTELKKFAQEIDRLLAEIKVCDPAAGSGAFPVGMMTEIVKARMFFRETNCFEEKKKQTRYNLKKDCIEYSLFGVDIDPGAVEIAKLRLWLSLVVEEENIEEIEALPNLDYKIKQGDSLLSYYHGVSLEPHKRLAKGEYAVGRKQRINEAITEITNKKQEFFSTSDAGKKKAIQTQIDNALKSLVVKEIEIEIDTLRKETAQDNLFGMTKKQQEEHDVTEQEIARLSDVKSELIAIDGLPPNFPIIWDVDFGEVLGEGGFNVVIANPPYVRQEKIKEMKDKLELNYECFTGTSDLYTYFYERGIKLLKPTGTLTFISSNKFFRAGYGLKLRQYLSENTTLQKIIDFGDLPVFEATTYPCIVIAKKHTSNGKGEATDDVIKARTVKSIEELEHFEETFHAQSIEMRQSDLSTDGWRIEDKHVLALLEKIKKAGVPLVEYVAGKIYRGITTGYNEAFVIDEDTKNRLIREDKKSLEVMKPFLRGRDIKRYVIDDPRLWLIYVPYKWTNESRGKQEPEKFFKKELPTIYNHLKQFENQLKKRDDQGDYWWEMRPCKYLGEFEKAKIIIPRIQILPSFSFDTGGHVLLDSSYIIPMDDLYLLGILNSMLFWFICRQSSNTIQNNYLNLQIAVLIHLSITKGSDKQRHAVAERVKQILKSKKENHNADTTHLEREIDEIIYEIYGLTEEDRRIVEGK